jgi:hypothetical protein
MFQSLHQTQEAYQKTKEKKKKKVRQRNQLCSKALTRNKKHIKEGKGKQTWGKGVNYVPKPLQVTRNISKETSKHNKLRRTLT